MVTYEEIGRRIRLARAELGLLQADLGRLLERPRSHAAISDIERGKTKLDLEELAEVARVLRKPLSYFIEAPSAPGVVYHRSERDMSTEQRVQTRRSVQQFQELARQRAQRRDRDDVR